MADHTSKREFLEDLEQIAIQFRATIEAKVTGFNPDPTEAKARAKKALGDFRFFAITYFPHYLRNSDDAGFSQFQKWLIKTLPAALQSPEAVAMAVAAPRGEAKSTYMLIFALWMALKKSKRYMIYIMDSYEQAAVVVEAYKAELEINPRVKMDFPKEVGRGHIWREGECTTVSNVKFHARGAGQKIRGLKHGAYRPDAVFLDDIENDENVKSPAQRDKLEDWLDKAVQNLGEAGAKYDIFYIGTILHYDAVLARTQKTPFWQSVTFQAIIQWPTNMDLWEQWEEIVRNDSVDAAQLFYDDNIEAMESGAILSWPGKRDLLTLMKKKVAIKDRAFNSEYQNNPSDDGDFSRLTFWVEPKPDLVLFGACDPSLGKKGKSGIRRGDPSAILIGGFNRALGTMDVLAADIKRRKPGVIIDTIIKYQREYECYLWFFESVQFQEFMREQLIQKGIDQGVNIPAKPVIPLDDKTLRIQSLIIPIEDERIRIHASQKVLKEQLEQWPNAAHDDGPDALEMLWNNAITHGHVGEFNTGGHRTMTQIAQPGILGRMRNRGR